MIERTASFLWGKGVRKDKVVPKADLDKITKLIDNPTKMEDILDDMLPLLAGIREKGSEIPGAVEAVRSFDVTLRNAVKTLMGFGLWPHLDTEKLQDALNDSKGMVKYATEEISEVTEHNLKRFVEVLPKILKAARRVLSNFADKDEALVSFQHLVHDVLFGEDGVYTKAEDLHKLLQEGG